MPLVLSIGARVLFTLGLALWLGGLIALGALVAPVTAHFLQAHPELAGASAIKGILLTGIVGGSLRVFNVVCFASGILMLLAQALLWKVTSRRLSLGIFLVVFLLLASALYQSQILFPAMDALQAQGRTAAFDHLHKRYESLSIDLQFPLLLILAILGAVRDTLTRQLVAKPV